jgi:hypothetical protein
MHNNELAFVDVSAMLVAGEQAVCYRSPENNSRSTDVIEYVEAARRKGRCQHVCAVIGLTHVVEDHVPGDRIDVWLGSRP